MAKLTDHNRQLRDESERQRRFCQDWLKPLIKPGQPKPATKAELCTKAACELKVSKRVFDRAWVAAIEETGRHDWYEPLRTRKRKVR